MKTIKLKIIDGYRIIDSIQSADGFIDPEETKKIVNVKIQKTETFIEISRLKTEMYKYVVQAKQAFISAKNAKTESEKQVFVNEYQKRREDEKGIEEKLKPLAKILKQEYRDLTIANAKYTGLPALEEYREDDEAETIADEMIAATQNNSLLALNDDGTRSEIPDYRGKKYWNKKSGSWTGVEISNIGVKPVSGAILDADLTESQREEIAEQHEKERIEKLSAKQKEAEKDSVIDSIAAQADSMRGKLEIQGDKNALKKAQEWYAEQLTEIELKYA